MSPIELVVFDIAGTTVEDHGVVNRCLRDALAAAGLSLDAAEVNHVMGLPRPLTLARLIDGAGRTRDLGGQVEAIHRDFVARALAFYREDPSVREVPGAGLVLRSLRDAGLRVALDTGFDRPITDAILRRLDWAEGTAVDATITSDEVALGRPHPDMILTLMRRMGVESPARVAKAGDTPSDLEEGTSAGCGLVVGVTGGTHSREQIEPFPHTHLIASIRELPAILGLTD